MDIERLLQPDVMWLLFTVGSVAIAGVAGRWLWRTHTISEIAKRRVAVQHVRASKKLIDDFINVHQGTPTYQRVLLELQQVRRLYGHTGVKCGHLVWIEKGLRVVEWMRTHEKTIGVPIAARVSIPRSQISAAVLNQVVPISTSLVPLEKFRVPAGLDGRAGRFRAQPDQCLLEASNDYEAITAWLAGKRGRAGNGGLSPTQRAYRREGERLLLWSILERGKPLSSLTVEDVTAFCDFLRAPPPSWCGPRHEQRWSPLWRPLEGPLSPSGQRQAITILRSLFTFLVSQHYVIGNPFNAVALPRESGRMLGSNRTLTFAQWDLISAQLDQDLARAQSRRRARAIRWLYATGLRTAEITAARCGDLSMLHFTDDSGAANTGWLLTVIGKGEKVRQVPVPGELVDELEAELQRCGYPGVQDEGNADLPLLALFEGKHERAPWTPSGLYQSLKAFMDRCSQQMTGQDAAQLRKASTHWLRHSHGSHALNGRDGHDPVAIQIVRNSPTSTRLDFTYSV